MGWLAHLRSNNASRLGLGRLLRTPHPLTAFLTQHFHKSSQFPLFLRGPKTGHGQYKHHPLGFLKPLWSSLPRIRFSLHSLASFESLPRISFQDSAPITTSCQPRALKKKVTSPSVFLSIKWVISFLASGVDDVSLFFYLIFFLRQDFFCAVD